MAKEKVKKIRKDILEQCWVAFCTNLIIARFFQLFQNFCF